MASIPFHELTDRVVALYHQHKREEALQLIAQHQDLFPEQAARLTFWRMCFLSLMGRPEDVLAVFQQGLASGLWWQTELFADPDLNAVRDLPEFQRLIAVSQEKYEAAQGQIERDYTILVPEPPASGLYPLLVTLHGRNGHKESDLVQWELARQRGWLVLSCQSTQPVFQGAYHWDNPARGLDDLSYYYKQVSQQYRIDPGQIVIAGFSQGSGMAIYAAMQGRFAVQGFIGIASWWAEPKALIPQGNDARRVRGYFVTGEKDHTFETAKEIQSVLREQAIQFDEELHADLAHAFSPDFGRSFEKAIGFIFKE